MKLRRAVLALSTCVAFVPAGSAHAAGATIETEKHGFTHRLQQESNATLVVMTCTARGVGGTPTQVAVATRSRCSINGTQRSASAPGSVAVSEVAVAAVSPVVVCSGGSAVFMETGTGTNELTYVDVPDACVIWPS